MNERKICFILCVNQEVFLEECCFYINRLFVPEGFQVEIKPVRNAACMTAGYNQAMQESDAKYKVFLHQDVFIVNRHFIEDILQIFEADEQIGMIGMVGCKRMAEDGVMWHSLRYGNVYGSDAPVADIPITKYGYSLKKDGYIEVEAADGFLLAVNDDIFWREDLFRGWDFYDASQSFEYRKRGKKIVVPVQKRPWCVHNDGILSMWDYESYRQIFVKEYGDMLWKRGKA